MGSSHQLPTGKKSRHHLADEAATAFSRKLSDYHLIELFNPRVHVVED